jgi:hypothetical protein
LELKLDKVNQMQIKSDRFYIDYLDYTVIDYFNRIDPFNRLKFDLLLFSEDVLCMSVPACVKLETTTTILMELTPFWNNNKIKLILDNKHRNNPWNYFRNRNHILEKTFPEQELIKHFEYIAYNSKHTKYFYDTYIHDIVIPHTHSLYIDKIYDTDDSFRKSVISQINRNMDIICSIMPIKSNLHMGKIFNELYIMAENRHLLFQRTAIENQLLDNFGATMDELTIIGRILDNGFAYSNAISCGAVPLSLIQNRLTGRELIHILSATDYELFSMVKNLNWNEIYRLSNSDIWRDFTDRLNRLLQIYQLSKERKETIYTSRRIHCSLITYKLIQKLYESAIESLQMGLLRMGYNSIDFSNLKDNIDSLIDDYLNNKNEYFNIIREIDKFIPALKVTISSFDRKYKDVNKLSYDTGYSINLDYKI